ncbi:response regulator transcription factor [Leucobacter sp. HY1910]
MAVTPQRARHDHFAQILTAGVDAHPECAWRVHFRNQVATTPIVRSHLFRAALESRAQWINYSGAPGMGRTTLLQQIEQELQRAGEFYVGVWTTQQATALYDCFNRDAVTGTQAFARELRQLMAERGAMRITVIIDDYDLHASPTYARVMLSLIDLVPGFRLITSTFSPLEVGDELGPRMQDRFMQPSSGRLFFSYEESRQVFMATLASGEKFVLPSDTEIRQAFGQMNGMPFGIALAADRRLFPAEYPESVFAQMMQAVNRYLLETHPKSDPKVAGLASLIGTFALMPRFKDQHISQLFPGVTDNVLREFRSNRALDPGKAVHAGEYAWGSDFWEVLSEWNSATPDLRRNLAAKLTEIDDTVGAFGQWLLLGDLARCEKLLRSRFFLIYETLAPELVEDLLRLGNEQLRGFPTTRLFRSLLDPHTTQQNLLSSIANLSNTSRSSCAAQVLLARALRCVLHLRLGGAREAVQQARALYTECYANMAGQGSLQLADLSTDAQASLAEATLVAAHVLVAAGTTPQGLDRLPSFVGFSHLASRAEVLQGLIDVMRGPVDKQPGRVRSRAPIGYRALVLSPSHGFKEIAAYDTFDRVFTTLCESPGSNRAEAMLASGIRENVGHTGPAFPRHELPTSTRAFWECLTLVHAGELREAVRLQAASDIAEPAASLFEAALARAKGQYNEALACGERLEGKWGVRVDAAVLLLRACALTRRGQREAARHAVYDTERLPAIAVAQAFMLLGRDEGEALADLAHDTGVYRQLVEAAQAMRGEQPQTQSVTPPQALTKTEIETLLALRRGLNTREIADEVHVSVNTVRTHVRAIARKLGASGQAEILRKAHDLQLLSA